MKKLIIITLIGFSGWNYYTKNMVSQPPVSSTPIAVHEESVMSVARNFSCDGRQHCSQMRSYAEAEYFLRNCPGVKMDGDHDGIPCERQFGR